MVACVSQCLALIQTKQCSHVHPFLLCTKRCFPGSVTQCCSHQYTACRATCEMKNLGISFCVCLTVKSHFSCSQLITLHHRRSNPFGCLRRFYCFLIWGNSEAEKMLFLNGILTTLNKSTMAALLCSFSLKFFATFLWQLSEFMQVFFFLCSPFLFTQTLKSSTGTVTAMSSSSTSSQMKQRSSWQTAHL